MEERRLAPLTLLERVELEIRYLTCCDRVSRLRRQIALTEIEQQELRTLIHVRLGPLHQELENLQGEIRTLEVRLRRLLRVTRPLSDEELDAEIAEEEEHQGNGRGQSSANFRDRTQFGEEVTGNGHNNELLRRVYRALARLLHPDLARDQEERLQREQMMRLVNQARERGDLEQLEQLLSVWSDSEGVQVTNELEQLRRNLAAKEMEELHLRRRLRELQRAELSQLAKKGASTIESYLRRQEELLRHEVAGLRLKRRRLLRLIEERRRELLQRVGLSS